jgi:hypothetical protein
MTRHCRFHFPWLNHFSKIPQFPSGKQSFFPKSISLKDLFSVKEGNGFLHVAVEHLYTSVRFV